MPDIVDYLTKLKKEYDVGKVVKVIIEKIENTN
jgi:hypothetical protein